MTDTVEKETNLQIIERGLEMIKPLQEAGIPTSVYSRGPDGADIFTMGKTPGIPGSLLVWPGAPHIDLSASTDKNRRQAALRVVEKKRVITKTVFLRNWDMPNDRKLSVGQLRMHFPTNLPDTAVYKQMKVEPAKGRVQTWSRTETHGGFKVTIRATVPATNQSLLCGIDETAVFVAMLPETVDTVEEAHEILRPKTVPADKAVRQGEWFFVPANKAELKAIEAQLTKMRPVRIAHNQRLESESSHQAAELVSIAYGVAAESRRYARGKITDRRAGHHKNLNLEEWHRVVRNAETTPAPKARRWD